MSTLDRVGDIARAAGAAILEIYGRADFGTTYKDDRSPLTLADRAAHDVIVAGLHELDASVPVLSEESEAIPYQTRAAWERFWIVDPLDGTKEFIKRNGEFTVNIALVENGKPVLGVVHSPALDRTYAAQAGGGATRQDAGGAPQRIVAADYRDAGLRVVASRSHAGDLMPPFLAALGDPECISIGSSLKLCLVADGSATLYPRFGPTMEWDVAAAVAVVNEAGGAVVSVDDGIPLAFNKPDLHNPWFVVTANPPYPWRPAYDAAKAAGRPA